MENEQIAPVDFEGANRIYLAGLLDEAWASLPVMPNLPVPTLDSDAPEVLSLLHLMRQRDEMASAASGLLVTGNDLSDAAAAARDRLADAEARIAAARDALLAGNEPEPRDAMLALVIDQIHAEPANRRGCCGGERDGAGKPPHADHQCGGADPPRCW